ncbi:MAG: protein kinase, partial [Muribaculaceae bacterium]|nr:protein kinase [Muribaculaceae bacterium]
MKDMQEIESGYIGRDTDDCGIVTTLTDVEIISTSGTNVIARGRRFGRFWLLKGIIPRLRESSSARRRLQKEFELHSRLLHPNIVRVAALEDIPSLGTCIVEEWVEGETLATLLRSGQLSKGDRRRILREIIYAVGYMHSMGVVHRD